jgi:hypothetical protein
MSDDRLLRTRQAAECLGLSLKRFAMFARRLPHLVPGKRSRYYRQSDLDRLEVFLQEQPAPQAAARSQGRMPTSGDFWRE